MREFSLQNLLTSSAERMQSELDERLIDHPGELGQGREEIIREFLRKYLPKRFDVSTGFAFDANGNISKQLDIVIADALICPRFETAGGIRLFPCESIVAAGQVKSAITSRDELRDALENLQSVKALDRSANGQARDASRDEAIDHRWNYLHQVFTFLLITGPALAQNTAHEEILNHVLAQESHVWPNIVFAISKYLITYHCDDGVCPNAMHARGVALQPQTPENDLLIRFYILLGQALEVTRVTSLPYWEYLRNTRTWTAIVHYSTFNEPGEPPPYLNSIPRCP